MLQAWNELDRGKRGVGARSIQGLMSFRGWENHREMKTVGRESVDCARLRERDRQTDRQTYRQTYTETETETDREK